MIPARKISETILEFGSPMLRGLPENVTKDEFEAVLRFIVTAWNSVVLDGWYKTNKYESEFRQALSQMPIEISGTLEKLINRKKRKYSSDPRAVGNYSVIEKNGEFIFRAEARLDLQRVKEVGSPQ